ncbi:MAG: DUF4142 domain-containing protein [Phaeodactylibacter sp.]|nr:DUF4142 domain-containing protein [Phaeodactylibacter sp.]
MRTIRYLTIALAGFLFVACQQTPKQEAQQENDYRFEGLAVSDEVDVLTNYAANTLLSIQLADVAAQNAEMEPVRSLAAAIAKDHRQLYNELEKLAANLSMALPARLSEEQKETVDLLKSKSGKELDESYLDMVVGYHEAFSDKMENIIEDATHESVMDFARLVDSHQYVHLNEAKKLKMELDA